MKKFLICIFSLLVVFLVGGVLYVHHQNTPLTHLHITTSNTATVLIPGSNGSTYTFNGMIRRLTHKKLAHLALKVTIDANGVAHIRKVGALTQNPLIQLTFVNNQDPQKQMQYLPAFMKELKSVYYINSVNFVAHSMGGSVVLEYLENKQVQTSQYPKITKFVAIGTPFGYITPQNSLATAASNLPSDLKILNIAGNLNHTGTDTAVPLKSNEALQPVVAGHVASYRHITIEGNRLEAQHSALHENPKVDKLIVNFLWN